MNVGDAYTAVTPFRLVDTRAGSGYYGQGQKLGPGVTFTFPVAGEDDVPDTVTAAALNVTVTDTTTASFLSVYPAGTATPVASNLNWLRAGENVPNLVIVPVGTGGAVTAYNQLGDTDVVVDLEGYFAPESGASSVGSYVALTPDRICDTRPASYTGSTNQCSGRTMGAGKSLTIQVSGEGGLPTTSDLEAALLNVTVTDTGSSPDGSFMTVYPQGGSVPTASNLNWANGQTIANRVVVPVNTTTGEITLYNALGKADVVVDVDGYFSQGATPAGASLYTPISPTRLVDTRADSGEPGAGDTLGPDTELTAPLSEVGSLGSDVTAVVTNVTVTDTSAPSFLTVYPGPTLPVASDLNWVGGETVPNLAIAKVDSSGDVSFYNDHGATDLVVDAFGYFSSAGTLSSGVATSNNWSGYVEQSGPQTAVAGTFVIPSLYQGPTGTYMAAWVGIDGLTDTSVIQAGVDEYPDPSDPTSFYYYPWYELYPSAPVDVDGDFPNMTPGDSLTVTITDVSGNSWQIVLDDTTQSESYTTTQTYTGLASSAEWIVEAPLNSTSGTIYPLAGYTPTEFTGISASGPDTSDTALEMVQNDAFVSLPSAPGEGGSSFNINYGDTVPQSP
ncbi:MAG: G1 family glutamic endopeptidase [Candidatus Dormibacteria bacterium]